MKKLLLVTVLTAISFSLAARELVGRDQNGNECSIEVVKDQFIEHENPERILWPSYAQISTSERITTVNFSYLKSNFFGSKEVRIKGYTVDNQNNNVYGGYSMFVSRAQSSERVNARLGIEGMELVLYFDTQNRELSSFKYLNMYDESDIAVICKL